MSYYNIERTFENVIIETGKQAAALSFSLFLARPITDEWVRKYNKIPDIVSTIDLMNRNIKTHTHVLVYYIDRRLSESRYIWDGSSEQTFLKYLSNSIRQINHIIYIYTLNEPAGVYYGSIIRYRTLQDTRFDIVHIRDPHSTLPNTNMYDINWINHWIYINKQFLMYTSPVYNPDHSNAYRQKIKSVERNDNRYKKRRIPFAATLSFRRIEDIGQRLWAMLERPNYDIIDNKYGQDEQQLHFAMHQLNMNSNMCLYVGITWLQWIFHNVGINPETSLNLRWVQNNNVKNMFQDISCVTLLVLNYVFNHLKQSKPRNFTIRDVTMKEYFDYVEQKQIKGNTIYMLLPSRWHLWDYLFIDPNVNNIDNMSFYTYVETKIRNFPTIDNDNNQREPIDIDSMCMSFKIFYGKYYDPENQYDRHNFDMDDFGTRYQKLNDLIPFPPGHPLYFTRATNTSIF